MCNSAVTIREVNGIFLALVSTVLILLAGCSGNVENPLAENPKEGSTTEALRLATTTSTHDSGLLEELLPVFEQANRCRVDVVAIGSGAALKLGQSGDVDVVLVHARKAEEAFMQAKHGVRHVEFMYNGFVLLGPKDDPAQIRGLEPARAMTKIAEGKHRFVSRGDDSGTHKREMSLWQKAGGRPAWEAYLEGGQGMGPTLVMANEKQGYVLTDMGTFLHFRDKIELVPLAAHGEILRNPYAAIVVNPEKHERINARLANAFADFLISEEGQRLVAGYQIAGRQLFYPTRLAGES